MGVVRKRVNFRDCNSIAGTWGYKKIGSGSVSPACRYLACSSEAQSLPFGPAGEVQDWLPGDWFAEDRPSTGGTGIFSPVTALSQ